MPRTNDMPRHLTNRTDDRMLDVMGREHAYAARAAADRLMLDRVAREVEHATLLGQRATLLAAAAALFAVAALLAFIWLASTVYAAPALGLYSAASVAAGFISTWVLAPRVL